MYAAPMMSNAPIQSPLAAFVNDFDAYDMHALTSGGTSSPVR